MNGMPTLTSFCCVPRTIEWLMKHLMSTPPDVLEEWKREHEQDASETAELSSDLLEQLVVELNPTMLLVHVTNEDLEILRDVVDWEPDKEFPEEQDSSGTYPIVVTFDNLKELLGRTAVPYRQKMNGKPMYKQVSDWTEDEIIAASSIAAQITKSAIQYYQVEGNRLQSEYIEEL